MKSEKKLEQILASLKASQPALTKEDAADLTSRIAAGIANKKQVSNTNGKLLSIAKVISAAAAVLLFFSLLYQQTAEFGDHEPGVVYNPYYKKAVRDYGSIPRANSISELLDYYTQNKKSKSAIASFREQYNQSARKIKMQ